ncbi:MAG: hypothetical protein ABIR04_04360 [Cypionkella sp.]
MGAHQLAYIDEANLAKYARAGEVYPQAAVVPASYDIEDFRVDLANVASFKVLQHLAPFVGGGDVLTTDARRRSSAR